MRNKLLDALAFAKEKLKQANDYQEKEVAYTQGDALLMLAILLLLLAEHVL